MLSFSVANADIEDDCIDALFGNKHVNSGTKHVDEANKRNGDNRKNFLSLIGNDDIGPLRSFVKSNGMDIHTGIDKGMTALRWGTIVNATEDVKLLLEQMTSFSEDAYDDFHMSYIAALKYKRSDILDIMDETLFGHGESIEKLMYIVKDITLLKESLNNYKLRDMGHESEKVQNRIDRLESRGMWLLSKMPGYYIKGEELYFESKRYNQFNFVNLPSLYNGTMEDYMQLPLLEVIY